MAVRYLTIDNEFVSRPWHVFLVEARKAGVDFHLNEGKRTLARQAWFYQCWRSQQCNGGNLAAFPSPFAPHIRVGRINHAIDVNGSDALIAFGARNGVTLTRTVAGESWHLEASSAHLRAYAAKHTVDPLKPLGREQRRAVGRLFFHRRKRTTEARSGKGPRWAKQNRHVARWHKRVKTLHDREQRKDRKDVLHRALEDRDGRL